MGAVLYAILEESDSPTDCSANGQALSRASDELDNIARDIGEKPLTLPGV